MQLCLRRAKKSSMIYELVLEAASPASHIKHLYEIRNEGKAAEKAASQVKGGGRRRKTAEHIVYECARERGFRFYGNDGEICLQLTFDNRQMRIYRILMGLLHGTFLRLIFSKNYFYSPVYPRCFVCAS